MKSISISENLHKWIMGHKDSERKSAEKVIFGLIGALDRIAGMESGEHDGNEVHASSLECSVCAEIKKIAKAEL